MRIVKHEMSGVVAIVRIDQITTTVHLVDPRPEPGNPDGGEVPRSLETAQFRAVILKDGVVQRVNVGIRDDLRGWVLRFGGADTDQMYADAYEAGRREFLGEV